MLRLRLSKEIKSLLLRIESIQKVVNTFIRYAKNVWEMKLGMQENEYEENRGKGERGKGIGYSDLPSTHQ